MNMVEMIEKKKRGQALADEEIAFFVDGLTQGTIPDYQISALAMAIFFRSMNERETAMLTRCMAKSGDMLDLSCFGNRCADKHSTGGVGDKTTMIVGPMAAAMGIKVAKMSGRGLGFTGGTADKLEAIPGFCTNLKQNEMMEIVSQIGLSVVSQSGKMTPADKKLYALRDVTGTVDSIPLIASSIMSKKIAAGAPNIVLDVKVGNGAFMKDYAEGKKLAEAMVEIGRQCGRRTIAIISDMNQPLGRNVGNTLEVIEAIDILKGTAKDGMHASLRELCIELAAHMAVAALDISIDTARLQAKMVLENGSAFSKMQEWIQAQGGDIRCLSDTSLLPISSIKTDILSSKTGYIAAVNAENIGHAALLVGAGRLELTDKIDHGAGIVLNVKPGDYVKKGDCLCTLYSNKCVDDAFLWAEKAFEFSETVPFKLPFIYETIA